MESLVFDLFQVLERQREILKEMLTAARNHNHALRQNDIVVLKEIIIREEKISTRLKAEERQRDRLQKALGKRLGLPGDASLSKMLPDLPQKQSARLAELTAEMRNIAGQIARLVELNRVLTREAMHFNERLLRLLKPIHNNTYQPDGKSTSPVGCSSSLINKIV
ncbi:FlgN protein [Pelotomaculum sp. FP]|uniref:flagellar protein FlgN n=1 Tax=Pelotomaculum sp. FP TaxID=261474 RepID=UPI0010669349|nr:flagellar protein FlgN [Pelotomaculum sp. FP]TEB15543.1 FlgN protein [Pelotomaculum sp. FP]